jgi:hypothetical protein
MNIYGTFILGFFLGFILASFLIGWYAEQHEKENTRLRLINHDLKRELIIEKAKQKDIFRDIAARSKNLEFDP